MSTTTVLNDVKLLLGLQNDDEKLETIVRLTEGRLKALLSVKIIPDELESLQKCLSNALIGLVLRVFKRIQLKGSQCHLMMMTSLLSLLRFNLGEMNKPIKIKGRYDSYEV